MEEDDTKEWDGLKYLSEAPEDVRNFVIAKSLIWEEKNNLTGCPAWTNGYFSIQCEEWASDYESLVSLDNRYAMVMGCRETKPVSKASVFSKHS